METMETNRNLRVTGVWLHVGRRMVDSANVLLIIITLTWNGQRNRSGHNY